MLKNRVTPDEFNALDPADQKHYSKGNDAKGEGYFLQTEENTGLKRSLTTERTEKDRAVKLLKMLVPDLTDENRADWEDLVTTAAEHAKALKDAGVDLDEWNAFKAGQADDPKGGKGKGAEAAEQLLEAQKRIRELERDKLTLERDKKKADEKSAKLTTANERLARERAIDKALDAAKITDPEDREVVTALLERKGIVVREVGSGDDAKLEAFIKVDGVEVPVDEHTRDFVNTDMGKRFVKAPDNSGGGDGPNPTPKPPTKDEFAAMDPLQKLGAALDNSAAAGGQGKK
jgi:hypothetical protein